MNILIIGAPASGKGTLCKKIAREYNFKHISSGDIFRAEIASGSNKGKLIASFSEKGQLAPSDILIDIMKEFLSKPENRDNMLLDGFGKTLDEAKELDWFYKIDKVLYLDADYENLIKRIAIRRICPDCGTITTVEKAPDGLCPDCRATLKTRADDTEFVYKTRFDVFQNQTLPIVKYFEGQGKLFKIDANQSADKIYCQVRNIIGNHDQENCKNY